MAGTLKPSTAKDEALYTHIGGSGSGYFKDNGARMFNEQIAYEGGGNSEGYYASRFADYYGKYLLLDIKEKCNIYAQCSFHYTLDRIQLNYIRIATGKLQILQYDGTDYTIDVTDKYWIGKRFDFKNESTISNDLTLEQFLAEYLIDRKWQKIIADLPPGQYKFNYVGETRHDDEWFLERASRTSKKVKSSVKEAILNHKLIKEHVAIQDMEE